METGKDSLCPTCMDWMPYDDNGKCTKCGTFINIKTKNYSWFENYGVELKELENLGDF